MIKAPPCSDKDGGGTPKGSDDTFGFFTNPKTVPKRRWKPAIGEDQASHLGQQAALTQTGEETQTTFLGTQQFSNGNQMPS